MDAVRAMRIGAAVDSVVGPVLLAVRVAVQVHAAVAMIAAVVDSSAAPARARSVRAAKVVAERAGPVERAVQRRHAVVRDVRSASAPARHGRAARVVVRVVPVVPAVPAVRVVVPVVPVAAALVPSAASVATAVAVRGADRCVASFPSRRHGGHLGGIGGKRSRGPRR